MKANKVRNRDVDGRIILKIVKEIGIVLGSNS
jgi:hypothetical protein